MTHNLLKSPIDHTSLWSTFSQRQPRYTKLDPETEAESDPSSEHSRPNTKKDGPIKLVMTRDDWKQFYADRLRNLVVAPDISNRELVDIFERNRRICFLNRRRNEKDEVVFVDDDLPPCYYWNKFQVADWATSVGLSNTIKEMLLNSGITGKLLITLDASTLLKMGLYDLNIIKRVTYAVREVLGLPQTNGVRAVARNVPLEMFLKMKVRTGREMDMLTFKEFCMNEGTEYQSAKSHKFQKYKPLPDRCRVVIKPWKYANVKWIPVEQHILGSQVNPEYDSKDLHHNEKYDSTSSSSSSDSDWLLHSAPTVEELANNVLMRNSIIPQLMNDIVENVFSKISENRKRSLGQIKTQQIVEQAVKTRMEQAYSDFSASQPEDKLKLITFIAEELVQDILRAKEVLDDIDQFQTRINTELPKHELNDYQAAVTHYVQNILPAIVSAALKEMENSLASFHDQLDLDAVDSVSEGEESLFVPALFHEKDYSRSR